MSEQEYPDDLFAEAYWDGEDPGDEEYLECCLCTHSMNDECEVGSWNYCGPGRHLCVCCNDGEVDDDSDPNEYQPQA